jgi:hypothetical protein
MRLVNIRAAHEWGNTQAQKRIETWAHGQLRHLLPDAGLNLGRVHIRAVPVNTSAAAQLWSSCCQELFEKCVLCDAIPVLFTADFAKFWIEERTELRYRCL